MSPQLFYFFISISFLSIFSFKVDAQDELTIIYKVNHNRSSSQKGCTAQLIHRGSESIYRVYDCEYNHTLSGGIIDRLQEANLEAYYVDYADKKIRYGAATILKDPPIVVEENIPAIDWQPTNRDTIFLGFAAKIMRAKFRGREYEVAYTEDLPVAGGPWKFVNLPGMVLAAWTVESDILEISAMEIQRVGDSDLAWEVVEQLKNSPKIYSMKDYCAARRKSLKKMKIKIESQGTEEDPAEFSFKDESLELGTYSKDCVDQ